MFSQQQLDLNQIDKLAQEGAASIADGQPKAAVSLFLEALEKSQLIKNEHSVRVCSCNLGALFLLLGDTQNALRYLHMSLLPQNSESNDSDTFHLNGDVYYNFGLAYLMIKDYEKAISNLKFSLENFDKVASKRESSAEAHILLAQAYTQLSNYQLGASEYKKAVDIFSELHEDYKMVKALINQATCLYHDFKSEPCLIVTKKCRPICKHMLQDSNTGKLYHDLGILFGRMKSSSLAIDCFKSSLKLLPSSPSTHNAHVSHDHLKLMKYRASCLEHIGELLNVEQHCQDSLQYHKEAIQLHSKLINNKAMGRCFFNLAYSYTQLQDYLKAERAYHNALQKMEEIGDLNGQWQAYESLADVNYQEQDIERAIVHYKLAASIVQHVHSDPTIHDRILSKLSNVLECQVSGAVRATLNRQRKPISISRTQIQFHGQSINSTPVHNMFAHNKIAPQAIGAPSVRPPVAPSVTPSDKHNATSTVKKPSSRKGKSTRKKKAKGRRRSGAFDAPVTHGIVSYESETELSCALQALAMDDYDDDWNHMFSDNARCTKKHRHPHRMSSSPLPDVDVSGSARPNPSNKSSTSGIQVFSSHSDDIESSSLTDNTSDETTQPRPWLNGTSDVDVIEGSHQVINQNAPVYAQVTKHKPDAVGGSDGAQEKLYETLNSKFEATALLGSSMPMRDPPPPPSHPPPPLPPRRLRQQETSDSSGTETSENDESTDSSDEDDDGEVSYKKYHQPQYMTQLSRAQREKGLYKLALRKAYTQSFEAMNRVQQNHENPSENPSCSMTTISSSDSDVSSKSTVSTKSKACCVM